MVSKNKKFTPTIPQVNLEESSDMLTDFSGEAQRHLISARNSLLVLETMPSDKEAIENVFKTFHTIKGLADFLHLKDIFVLTEATESLVDLARKNFIEFEGKAFQLVTQSIEQLQKLLELLDEQISNKGQLRSEYPDIGGLIASIHGVTSKKPSTIKTNIEKSSAIPTIQFEPNMSDCAQLENQIQESQGPISVNKDVLERLVNDFRKTTRELKENQSKLKERQRELIKERELAIKLTRQAQSEARAKSEYLANVSHEIRTLINAILGFTDILKNSVLNNKQKEHLNTIVLSGKMLLGIVNDILDFSKVEAGKLKFEKINFNLTHVVEEVFKIIRTRLAEKSINLYFDIEGNVPDYLIGDPTRLKQIFINLLDNAIKFTEDGEIGLEANLMKEEKIPDDKAKIQFIVRDTGIGIPEDHKKTIFESFTQADSSTTRLYGGSGLGLTLCKSFVQTMRGTIKVESELGKGSRFIFTIQLPKGKFDKKLKERTPRTLRDFAETHVMLVEQFESTAKVLIKLFQKNGIKILPVTSTAKQATELLLKQEATGGTFPNIIFIDADMPNKEGYMLAHNIRQREQYKDIKLVALTSDVKIDMTSDFRQAGFDMYLAKPIIQSELITLLIYLYGGNLPEQKIVLHDMLDKISCEGVSVLVVEDSAPNQELLKVHLEGLGCECTFASNGQEAVDLLKENTYDICFMDLNMPVLGGLQATQIIRQQLNSDIPIIALTAAEIQEEKEKCLKIGMDDYLPKPFGVDELKKKIIKCTKM